MTILGVDDNEKRSWLINHIGNLKGCQAIGTCWHTSKETKIYRCFFRRVPKNLLLKNEIMKNSTTCGETDGLVYWDLLKIRSWCQHSRMKTRQLYRHLRCKLQSPGFATCQTKSRPALCNIWLFVFPTMYDMINVLIYINLIYCLPTKINFVGTTNHPCWSKTFTKDHKGSNKSQSIAKYFGFGC